ncbi:metallophosphoesterase [Humisphaera borealis]|uniref:Metallophosphoesterase n=1 Tax=Humisphaera borealis TaxID=2807512 RepID=A0A7M2X376_9BACT|nr:metallophosphoesterase [Humisphaera borealis]QOV92173.1 metallophosphoesterase [Humisphaera borealis]
MPIQLPPISRRQFLGASLAALAGGAFIGDLRADGKPVDPTRVALFSDTHLAADAKAISRQVCMLEHFEAARASMLAMPALPGAMLINGDLALNAGLPGDYVTITNGLKPIREAGIPVHLLLGNHDDRDNFWKALPPEDANKAVEGKHLSILKSKHADLILLDSLEFVNKTPGLIGDVQRAWLAKALDARADRPCVVVVHHNPTDPANSKVAGIKDTDELMKVLLPRKQVKALVFGHTHKWVKTSIEGMHLVNLPPVAYPFKATDPSGWVDGIFTDSGAKLTLRCVGPRNPADGEVFDLKWRT